MMIYSLQELKEKNINAYLKVVNWMRKNVGSGSYEALEKFAKDYGMFADEDGNIYKLHYSAKKSIIY